MKIIESIRNYIGQLDCMDTYIININYLGHEADSFSLEEVPTNPIIKRYLDGSAMRQYQFVFCSREPYSNEILQNIENSTFYEDFANEIENKNDNNILPILNNGESIAIEVISTAYTVSVTEDTSMYQINLRFKYRK